MNQNHNEHFLWGSFQLDVSFVSLKSTKNEHWKVSSLGLKETWKVREAIVDNDSERIIKFSIKILYSSELLAFFTKNVMTVECSLVLEVAILACLESVPQAPSQMLQIIFAWFGSFVCCSFFFMVLIWYTKIWLCADYSLSFFSHTGTYIDKKCPFAGNVSIRGRIITGYCHSAKMVRTIIVRRDYLHFVKKYQRYDPALIGMDFTITYTFSHSTRSITTFPLSFLCFPLPPFLGLFQIWEEALKHSCTLIPMLPCEGRRSCRYRPMQVNFFKRPPCCHLTVWFDALACVVSHFDWVFVPHISGHCQRLWGSMCWKLFRLDLLVGRRLL